MYSACQAKGPFDNSHSKDKKPITAPPRERIDINPPIFDANNDVKVLEDMNELMTPAQLREKADHYIKENLNKYTKIKKNQK